MSYLHCTLVTVNSRLKETDFHYLVDQTLAFDCSLNSMERVTLDAELLDHPQPLSLITFLSDAAIRTNDKR